MAADERLLERVRAALGRRRVVEKRMFGGIAFLLRGNMCLGVLGSTLVVRLDKEKTDALLSPPHVRPMDFTGRPMRGFLYVDGPAIRTAASLKKWVERAVEYASGLPAKKGK